MATGIIAEYNPFHAGHAHQIAEIKKFSSASIVAVMSGNFTQRGEPTILDKWTRARLAIENGVDLVLELPFVAAVRSAQDFARGAVRLLDSLGVVDTLAFGAEMTDLPLLRRAAAAFDEKFFARELKTLMARGMSYAAAVTKVLAQITGADEKILRRPNTILAIEYLRALPTKISPLLIERVGAYDDLTLHEKFSSASAIRTALRQKSPPWSKISACVDSATLTALRGEVANGLVDEEFLLRPLLTKLLTSRVDDLRKIFGMTEGLEHRLANAASSARTFSELVATLIARRYTAARIRRLSLYVLLNVTAALINETDSSTVARVLAFNDRGRSLLRKIPAPVIKLTKHINRRDLFEGRRPLAPYQKILLTDVSATDLRQLLFDPPRPSHKDFSVPPQVIA